MECMYCHRNEVLKSKMDFVCEVDGYPVFLFKEQTFEGRCIVAAKRHVTEVHHMTAEEASDYFNVVRTVSRTIDELFAPDNINYAAYGDVQTHFHMHLVPKKEGGLNWGSQFKLLPEPGVRLTADQLVNRIELLKERIQVNHG